jgi:RNA polymerase sigma-70 factor (ECF subfamily)
MDESTRPAFPTTHWSRVITAGDPAAPDTMEALTQLCAAYWFPVYAFIRRKGHAPDAALDLTQDYFARLLEKGTLAAAEPARGRFRSFLMADCSHFLSNRHDRDRALKRGGGCVAVPIDARDTEGRFLVEPAHGRTPERLFEQDWAVAVLERVFDRLGRDYAATGRSETFERLRPVLTADPGAGSYATIARDLGTTEAAVQAAVYRLRVRFRRALRDEIAATLDDPAGVDDEIRALFEVLGR